MSAMNKLTNYQFVDSKHTLGNYMDGLYLYDMIATIDMNNPSQKTAKDKEDLYERYYNLLVEKKTSTENIKEFFYEMPEYNKLKKEHFEYLDQHRRILSETFSSIKCEYCKSHKTIVNVAQIRSSDEPATVFIKCQNSACRKFGITYTRAE